MLELRRINKAFGVNQIILDLNLSVNRGESVALFGPNGCGKSTLMRILLGLDRDYKGQILDPDNLLLNKSYLPQNHKDSILPWLSAKENIILPLRIKHFAAKEIDSLLKEYLEIIPLNFDINSPAGRLSGGEAQTICLLRALITKPKILFLDEPTSNLDYFATQEFIKNIHTIKALYPMTIFSILHDPYQAMELADRVVLLSRRPCSVLEDQDRFCWRDRGNSKLLNLRAF